MKTLSLTFDYEVFLGISGSIKNCILKPVNKLIKLLDEENIKAVFFVDILFLEQLSNKGLNNDFELIKLNIQELVKKGHSIELHIHPHWLDAKYLKENNQWDLSDDRRYRVSSLTKEEREIVFNRSYDLLLSICKEVDSNCQINAFRAGGLCIQPFDDFKDTLKNLGISIESSVSPGLKNSSVTHKYDFTSINSIEPYFFSEKLEEPTKEGFFLEFPILNYQVSFLERLLQKLKNISPSNKIFGDGKANGPKSTHKSNPLDKFKTSTYLFSVDGDYYEEILFKKLKKSKAEFITLLCHPKLLSEQSLITIKKLNQKKWVNFSDFNSKQKALKQEIQ